MLAPQAGDRACGVGKNPHLGWDQHVPLSAAHAVGHLQLVKLGILPKAVLHWVDMGKLRIRESRETCSKGSLHWRQREEMSSLRTENQHTQRD